MSHHKQIRQVTRSSRPRPGILDDWENEGGSLDWPGGDDRAGIDKSAGHADPAFALLDALPLGILITNSECEITYSNPASQKLYGASSARLFGKHWRQTIDERDRSAVPARWEEREGDESPRMFEVRIVTGSGQRIWTRHSIERLALDRAADGHIHTIEDISRMKAAEEAGSTALEDLSRERERARVTLESIGDAVISTDAKGRVTYLNPVAEHLTGWPREKANGRLLDEVFRVVDADTGKPIESPADQAIDSVQIVQMPANCLLQRPDGSELAIEDSAAPILNENGQLTGAVVIFRDRRLSRENTTKMAHLARHDALTGLANRVAFAEHFDQALKLARRHHTRAGLLFIDLDQFKQINDALGHKAGDRLLREVSRKLQGCVRSTDLVCRHGGDEFVVLLGEISRAEDAGGIAAKMLTAAARPHRLQGDLVRLDMSIGIALYPDDGDDMETLISRADAAMYHAKHDSSAGYYFHQEGMKRSISQGRIEQALNVTQRTDGDRLSRR